MLNFFLVKEVINGKTDSHEIVPTIPATTDKNDTKNGTSMSHTAYVHDDHEAF